MTASPALAPVRSAVPPRDDPAAFLAGLRERIGTRIGVSAWTLVDQARIDRFADATGDRQFVHVDPVRAAAETPFGGTVAHGYLTLSLLGAAAGEILPAHPCVRAALNLGADRVRFLAPVRCGTRLRGVFVLDGVSALPEGKVALRLSACVETDSNADLKADSEAEAGEAVRPVLRAELTLMLVLAEPDGPPPTRSA
ncbi:acyl dehydratase [Methylorubrum rhodinum]|uniref:Acyl dehydratase n=1 Tax=Methylorubrum rhodinum TaxID=29428 RepID=A0A840ZMC7_9HYPH|nr:MaoC family dehydratase [Methylorubrum rhodinum]MBB5757933.1 acyl dehydratase [Methylorubrum rhodinum]